MRQDLVDLVLEEAIENEDIDETLDLDLATELLHADSPFSAADDDNAKEVPR